MWAVIAFIATGAEFSRAQIVKKPLNVSKTRRERGEMRTVDDAFLARFDSEEEIVSPISLMAAQTPEDAQQAWRTVRSYYGMEIFIEFDIGTPGQTLRILIDSGSDWFWVTTDECRKCGGIKRYDPKESSTYRKIGTDEVVL